MSKKETLVSKVKGWMKRAGAFEQPSQDKRNIPIGFATPEPLEAQMLRVVRSELFRESVRRRAAADQEELPPEGPQSPHEVVYDEELGREMTRWEHEAIQRDRAEFDKQVQLRREQVRRIKADAKRKKAVSEPPVEDGDAE